MKTLKILITIAIIVNSLIANSQIKVLTNGNVGINVSNPDDKLDVYGGTVHFQYSDKRPMKGVFMALDPRWCSDSKIVFYKAVGADWIDIECKTVIQKSDSLSKTNLSKIEYSLDKIKKIDGYNFNWKGDDKGIRNAGLLAQQVERVIPEVVTTVDSTGEKLLSYTQLIPYLIESIKEQQTQIEALQQVIVFHEEELISLKKQVSELTKNDSKLKSTESTISSENWKSNEITLLQNSPNPFTLDTKIEYFIPDAITDARILIHNLQGKEIKIVEITSKGFGSITINGSELEPGMYVYTLVADNKLIDTKRMILTNP